MDTVFRMLVLVKSAYVPVHAVLVKNIDISPMIHPSRKLIQFYINNHESKMVWCRYIKVYIDYNKDNKNQEIGRCRVTINNVILGQNTLKRKVEAGK